jgi:hypothetical protein
VWTYGGGFSAGSKSQNTPEGLFDLSQDFVFVAYNYRLGITDLGNGPTYQHEGGAANLVVWDSTRAFEWVKTYIGDFGGNSNDVTAVGFSAGGSQVMFQMTRFGGNAPQLFEKAYIMSPGYVPGAGHHHAEQFWQNVSTAVGYDGGHLDCMREVDFSTLQDSASDVVSDYTYQYQPRVDGFIIPDTYEASLYQGHFNFSGPCVISHEQHEASSQAYSGVDDADDIPTELRIFFPSITDDVIEELMELYPEDDYTSAGLRFADMKQSLDLTGKNLVLTNALQNATWNAECALGTATHGAERFERLRFGSRRQYRVAGINVGVLRSSTGAQVSYSILSRAKSLVAGIPGAHVGANVLSIVELCQELTDRRELPVIHVVNEARAADGVPRVEDVRHGRVVDDDRLRDVAVQQRQVLDVVALVLHAVLAVQSIANDAFRVEFVEQRVGVFTETGRVHDDLVVLGHLDEELLRPRPSTHEYVEDSVVDVHWNNVVGVGRWCEGRVHQRLVQVEHQALLAGVVGRERW